MPRYKRQKRDLHALNEDGMVMCNPRDKEAALRAQTEDIATYEWKNVTCRNCLSLVFKYNKASQQHTKKDDLGSFVPRCSIIPLLVSSMSIFPLWFFTETISIEYWRAYCPPLAGEVARSKCIYKGGWTIS